MEDLKALNRRLIKKYGITLVARDEMEKEQGGVCAICGHPPKTRRLAVDHNHKFKYLRVATFKRAGSWVAVIVISGKPLCFYAAKRNQAIQQAREFAKKESVRGLLCFPCNAGLRKFSDDPARLRAAAKYLEKANGNTRADNSGDNQSAKV